MGNGDRETIEYPVKAEWDDKDGTSISSPIVGWVRLPEELKIEDVPTTLSISGFTYSLDRVLKAKLETTGQSCVKFNGGVIIPTIDSESQTDIIKAFNRGFAFRLKQQHRRRMLLCTKANFEQNAIVTIRHFNGAKTFDLRVNHNRR